MKTLSVALFLALLAITNSKAFAAEAHQCIITASESAAECKGNDAAECAKVLKQADCKCAGKCDGFIDTLAQCHAEFNQGIHLCTEGDLVCVNGLKSVRTNCIDEAQGTK
ncbi:hypothetical protein E2K93_04435 [Thalassotalea sp. HSM 43]|uniref:hypothetical protein n=1 Tax=Thalassotalea sp. HSM 43 TaxID=2552945 RepID=UPI0010800B2B|nr:hypothetical protein [Thalassotalea sp. HSM 43]QBY03673.1 hypothetical protein E2K93_04435 [Thalassotalea sp. HSM 43]